MLTGFVQPLQRTLLHGYLLQILILFASRKAKAQPEQINIGAFSDLQYESYWYSAQKGYSGVGIATKHKPNHIEYGTGIDYIDFEGRVIRLDFDNFSVISVYVPSATNISRLDLKMQFCYDFLNYLKELRKLSLILLFVETSISVTKLSIFTIRFV